MATTDFSRVKDYFRKRLQLNESGLTDHTAAGFKNNAQLQKAGHKSQCEILGIITDKPKHKQYACIESRKLSYKNWPGTMKVPTIDQLSEAGFAYTGVCDSVRCFYCGIGLKDWPEGACPWKQHVLASPTCGHVIQCKGKGYVNWIMNESDEYCDEGACDTDGVVDTVQMAMKRNEDAVSVARLYCSNEDIIKTAIKSLIKKDILRNLSAVDLVKVVEEIKEKRELEAEADDSESETYRDIEEANRQLKEPVTCKICFDAIASIIALPCGHLACCSQCIPALSKCAICRAQIKGTVRAQMVA